MPEEGYKSIQNVWVESIRPIRYSIVFVSLSALLESEFLNTYIKAGKERMTIRLWKIYVDSNILGEIIMLSEGRVGIDNTFTLHNGMYQPA